MQDQQIKGNLKPKHNSLCCLKVWTIIFFVIDIILFGFYIWGEVAWNQDIKQIQYIDSNIMELSQGQSGIQQINTQNINNQIIYISGLQPQVSNIIDPDYQITFSQKSQVLRQTFYCQWVENISGGKTKSYNYSKRWVNKMIDSGSFKDKSKINQNRPQIQNNPQQTLYPSQYILNGQITADPSLVTHDTLVNQTLNQNLQQTQFAFANSVTIQTNRVLVSQYSSLFLGGSWFQGKKYSQSYYNQDNSPCIVGDAFILWQYSQLPSSMSFIAFYQNQQLTSIQTQWGPAFYSDIGYVSRQQMIQERLGDIIWKLQTIRGIFWPLVALFFILFSCYYKQKRIEESLQKNQVDISEQEKQNLEKCAKQLQMAQQNEVSDQEKYNLQQYAQQLQMIQQVQTLHMNQQVPYNIDPQQGQQQQMIYQNPNNLINNGQFQNQQYNICKNYYIKEIQNQQYPLPSQQPQIQAQPNINYINQIYGQQLPIMNQQIQYPNMNQQVIYPMNQNQQNIS